MFSNYRTLYVGAVLLGLMGWIGCGGAQQITASNSEQAYEQAKELYDEGNYVRAIDYFQHVFNYGRTHEWADDAQFYLAMSYLKNEEYILASEEFSRFLDLYPQDSRAQEAAFRRALGYYRLSPPFQLDQSDTRQAINYLRLFLEQYPNSEYAEKGGQMLQDLRNKLAHKEYHAAQVYERRELFEAAAITYERVLDQYPETDWADDALLGAIEAYLKYSQASVQSQQAERLEKALENYKRFIQLFPESPLLREAEDLYTRAQNRMDELQG